MSQQKPEKTLEVGSEVYISHIHFFLSIIIDIHQHFIMELVYAIGGRSMSSFWFLKISGSEKGGWMLHGSRSTFSGTSSSEFVQQ